MAVYRGLEKITRPRGFLAYVNRIIHNQLGTYYRNKKKTNALIASVTDNADENQILESQEAETRADGTELEIREAEHTLLAMIDDCFSARARKQKQTFIALALREASVQETAEALGVKPANIYLLFHRARNHLLENCPQLIARIIQHLRPSRRSDIKGEAP